jgi:transposase InsO family protein
MGVVIQAESYKNELAAVYEYEHDDEVLEFYDQPSQMKLNYRAASGKPVGVWHTPDYFVIYRDRAGWIECKTAEDLVELGKEMPNRYVQDSTGHWHCPPGEQYASQFGLFYRVRSSAETNWTFYRNVTFLDDYWRADPEDLVVAEAAATEVIETVIAEPGIKLGQLLGCLKTANSDDVYKMLVQGQIYVDLNMYPLAEPDRPPVFRDQWLGKAHVIIPETLADNSGDGFQNIQVAVGELITWAGSPWRIINFTNSQIWLRFERESEQQNIVKLNSTELNQLIDAGEIAGLPERSEVEMSTEAREILAQAGPRALQKANYRYRMIVEPILLGQSPLDPTTHPRTASRYVANFKTAQIVHQCGYVGLIDQAHKQGNRLPKIPNETRELMLKYIEEMYENKKQPTKSAVHNSFKLACERKGLQACSFKTFSQAIEIRSKEEQTRKRRGRKAAAQQEAFYWELTYTTPRHGDRPLEIAHIDHTLVNLELLHSGTLKNLGRCWITFLIDAFSRRLLALYLSYDSPSYRSCMMVLRDCVRRHHRLPQMIVNDGGPEFHSTYYETLLARYECTKKERPSGKPRYGNVIERLFDTSQTQFLYNLTGNTQMMLGNLREVSKEVYPKNLANWTLPRLYARFCQWLELYNSAEHSTLGQSPLEAFATGIALGGERQHRMIPYNQDFIIDTMPTTRKGAAKADINRGVKINYIYYWHDAFRRPEISNQQVPVRYDPINIGLAYAFVNSRWTQCISEHYARLQGRSEKILKVAAEELRARNRRHTRQVAINGRRLAEFIEELEQEEQYFELLWREADNQRVVMMAEGNLPLDNNGQFSFPGESPHSKEVEQIEPTKPHQKPIAADDQSDSGSDGPSDDDDDIEPLPVFTL